MERMDTARYRVCYSQKDGPALPELDADFGTRTVILGANGSGKSSLIKKLRSDPGLFGAPPRPVIRVEGGRAIKLPDRLALDPQNFERFGTVHQASKQHDQKRPQDLATRVQDALFLLDRHGDEVEKLHSRAVTKWQETGKQGPTPGVGERPLDSLFSLFSRLLPTLSLSSHEPSSGLTCRTLHWKIGYNATAMSDGERQVLAILADVALLGNPRSLVLVDEPELNLHPALACRLWHTVESHLPDAVFVYATHCLSFAMRASVDKVLVLGGPGVKAIEVDNLHDIPRPQLLEFLGAVPGILSAREAIAVEGEDDSIDSVFYTWLVGRPEVGVVPVGGCNNVLAAVEGSDIWKRLASAVKIVGVIDRDYRSDEELDHCRSKGAFVLDFHEVESHLCMPDVISTVARGMGTVKTPPSADEVSAEIRAFFKEQLLAVVARRVSERLQMSFSVSLPKKALAAIKNEDELRSRIIKAATEASTGVASLGDKGSVDRVLGEEFTRCKKVLEGGDVPAILGLAPGKELLRRLYPMTGARSPLELARAVTRHVQIGKVSHLASLQTGLQKMLGEGGKGERVSG